MHGDILCGRPVSYSQRGAAPRELPMVTTSSWAYTIINVENSKLENVQWIMIPLHNGDPIFVIGLLSSVPPLARWRCCVPIQVCPLLILRQRVTFGGG